MSSSVLLSSALAAAFSASVAVVASAQHHQHPEAPAPSNTFQIPTSLTVEHEALHEELSAATKLGGNTGAAAQQVATLLHAHFVSEEEFALPPLALLRPLASGRVSPDMRTVITLTDRLQAELPRMLDEHKAIVAALDEMRRAAEAEGHLDAARFADRLTLHAQHEEEVLYPAALLVGELVMLKVAH
jgi:hypothetical protein